MLAEATTWVQSWALRTIDSSLQPSPDPRAPGSSSEESQTQMKYSGAASSTVLASVLGAAFMATARSAKPDLTC